MTRRNAIIGWITLAVFFVIFIVPFIFIFLTAAKDVQESAMLEFSWPSNWHVWENFMAVIKARNYMLLLAYFNSTVITVGAITLVVVLSAMIGYIIQRRPGRTNDVVMATIMAGLMISAGGRAHNLGPAILGTVQDIAWYDPDPGILQPVLWRAFVQVLYRNNSARLGRGRNYRRGQTATDLLPGDPTAIKTGYRNTDCGAVCHNLQRLHQYAILPSRS